VLGRLTEIRWDEEVSCHAPQRRNSSCVE
jgi:hypothetical protein